MNPHLFGDLFPHFVVYALHTLINRRDVVTSELEHKALVYLVFKII